VNQIISQYIKAKVPHFFVYAKDKEDKNVEKLNDSVVNKFECVVPNKPIQFKRIAGKFNYKMLMKKKKVDIDKSIIDLFEKLNKTKKHSMNQKEELSSYDMSYFYKDLINQFLELNNDKYFIVDVLVKYLYGSKNSKRTSTLWNAFGDILMENLQVNLKNTKQCESCGKRIEVTNNKVKYCDECAKFIKNEQNKLYYHLGK
jgi:hypothetical protein